MRSGKELEDTRPSAGGETKPNEAATDLAERLEAKQIGGYAVLRPLGRGGAGRVYSAFDEQLDRRVAIKLLHRESDHARLLREAQAMAKLSEPRVAQVYEVGRHGDRSFLVMEHVDGTTLRQWMALDHEWTEVLEVFIEAAHGLAAAHRAGIVHRDFKPANVMVVRDASGKPSVKILDFGLARAEFDAKEQAPMDGSQNLLGTQVTQHGLTIGTPAYMSPEQFLGRGLDAKTDQFSFCVGLWEALNGTRPFMGTTSRERLRSILEGPAHLPWNSRAPRSVRAALERGLSPEPCDRWPDLEALTARLQARPWGRWRPRTGIAVGVLGIAAAGAFVFGAGEQQEECGHEAAVRTPWEHARPTLVARYEGLGTPLASGASTWVPRQLDGWVEGWDAAKAQLCEASTSGSTSAAELELRQSCLDQQASQFRATVEFLGSLDAQHVGVASDLVKLLDDPDGCENATTIRNRRPRPDQPAVMLEAEEIRNAIEKARLLSYSAPAQANAQVDTLVERAQALGFLPLVAEAKAARARMSWISGDLATAETQNRECLDEAFAAQHLWLASEVAMSLARVTREQGRARESETFGRLALSTGRGIGASTAGPLQEMALTAEALGDAEKADQYFRQAIDGGVARSHSSSLHNNYGLFLLNRGQIERAIEMFETAIGEYVDALGQDHPEVAKAKANLAMAYAELGEYDAAEAIFAETLRIMKRSYGPDHPNLAVPLYEAARVQERRANYEAALAGYLEAKRVVASLPPEHQWWQLAHDAVVTSLINLGRLEEAGREATSMISRLDPARRPRDGYARAWTQKAMIEIALGLPFDATAIDEQCSTDVVTLPASVECHRTLGRTMVFNNRAAEGLRVMQAALARSEEDTNFVAEDLLRVDLAYAHAALEDYEAADRELANVDERLLREVWKSELAFTRAKIALAKGDSAGARAWAVKADGYLVTDSPLRSALSTWREDEFGDD